MTSGLRACCVQTRRTHCPLGVLTVVRPCGSEKQLGRVMPGDPKGKEAGACGELEGRGAGGMLRERDTVRGVASPPGEAARRTAPRP